MSPDLKAAKAVAEPRGVLAPPLTYELTRADYAAWESAPREVRGVRKFLLIVPFVVMGMALGLFEDDVVRFAPWLAGQHLLLLLAGSLLAWVLLTVLLTARLQWRIRSYPLLGPRISLETDLNGFTVEADGRRTRRGWRSVHVTRTQDSVYLTEPGEPVLIVPLRAFASESDLAIFADLATQLSDPPPADEGSGGDSDAERKGVVPLA